MEEEFMLAYVNDEWLSYQDAVALAIQRDEEEALAFEEVFENKEYGLRSEYSDEITWRDLI